METQHGAKWGIHWKAPTTMVALFLTGLATAIGHHIFYDNLDGKEIIETSSQWDLNAVLLGQEWKIRFGTVLAFLTQSVFAAAIDIAFQQAAWVAVREKPISVGGLDAMFSAGETLWSFFEFEFLRKANVAAVLGLLKWLMPLSALVTPATLTVAQSQPTSILTMPVPSINFSIVEPLYQFDMSVQQRDSAASNNGITPYMHRILSSTATSYQILPMKAVIPNTNSTYQLKFRGPSLRCNPPSAIIHDAIYTMTNLSYYFSTTVGEPNRDDSMEFENRTSWLAFAPSQLILRRIEHARVGDGLLSDFDTTRDFVNFARSCIVSESYYTDRVHSKLNLTQTFRPLCEGIGGFDPNRKDPRNVTHDYVSNTWPFGRITSDYEPSKDEAGIPVPLNYGRLWVWADNSTYDCVLTDTEYTARFRYSASEAMQRVDPDYEFSWTLNDLHGSYFATANALSTFLTGAIRTVYPASDMMLDRTRVTESAIFGALKISPQPETMGLGLSERVIIPEIRALARGKTVGELIEELSRNFTLSLFSAEKVLSLNSTTAEVTVTSEANIYSYSRRVLVITYAVTCGLALVAVLVGILSLLRNGVSHEAGFLTFLLTTRNPNLDPFTLGESMGAMPHNKKVTDMKLRFGLIKGQHGSESSEDEEDGQQPARVGFGFEDEVQPLVKGIGYR